MLFNSVDFALFLPVVFILYWLLGSRKRRAQNNLLLIASYFFYACWDWRFMFLLLFSTCVDYFTALRIQDSQHPRNRKIWLWLSITVNLGFLFVFKYYDFFINSFVDFVGVFGIQPHISTLQLILPVGISFYTFHGLSYIIDVYNRRIPVERNFIDYGLFVSFFPLLVAGPIERATHLLPQIKRPRTFDYSQATDGLKQILWGLFKKVVIADNCALIVNEIFNASSDYSGSTMLLGATFFTFQLYGDFSGYSDIAIGTAKLFGVNLLRNFAYPFFSRDFTEFWRRWHISLSSWFRDYVYIPLGGSKRGMAIKIRNVFIIFLLSGIWHGADWTWVIWGLFCALCFLPPLIYRSERRKTAIAGTSGTYFFMSNELPRICLTFFLFVISLLIFRAENLGLVYVYFSKLFSASLLTMPALFSKKLILLLAIFVLIEWFSRQAEHPFQVLTPALPRALRLGIYYFLIFVILYFGGKPQEFIYFQF